MKSRHMAAATRATRAAMAGALVLLAFAGSLPVHAGSAAHTYDSLGRLSKVTYSNGTVITYTYDAAGNRSSVVTTGAPS